MRNLVEHHNRCCYSVTQSCPTLCHLGLQHARPPCSLPSLEVCPSSCPLHRLWHPAISSSDALFYFCLQSFPASGTFPMSQLCIRWPKYWSFSYSIRPSNEYSGLVSLRIDWFALLAVQGTCRSLLQHHSSKASILQLSAFFMVQLSQLYVTTGKTIALTIWIFVSRVMSLLFNTLSRFVTAFLPRSNSLISWLQSPSRVILLPKKRKSVTTSNFSPSFCHEVIVARCPTPVFLLGKFHRRRSLVGCSPWDHWESDTTEWLYFHFSLSRIGEGNGNPLQCSCLENPRILLVGCHLWGCTKSDMTGET